MEAAEPILVDAAIFLASMLSGTLGVGVAFLAIPILSFGSQDLVGSIQPIALLLNGVSGMFAACAFAANGLVDWNKALRLALSMCVAAPLGVLAARHIAPAAIWIMFYVAVALVIWLLFKSRRPLAAFKIDRMVAASIPVAFLCGVLGVGPGFVMVPLLIGAGLGVRAASGITSVAVVPFSFAALGMHIFAGARVDAGSAALLGTLTAAGALAGGVLASRVIADRPLRVIFAVTIIGLCASRSLIATHPAALSRLVFVLRQEQSTPGPVATQEKESNSDVVQMYA